MQFSTLLSVAFALANLKTVMGHGIVSDMKVGDTWYKGSNPFQDPYVSGGVERIVWSFYGGGNGPVEDVSSDAIVCNAGAKAAALTAPVAAGDKVELDWTTWPDSHKGPVMTYLANCNGDCSDATPSALKWFKIDEAGYDASSSTWATDDLIKNNNSWTVTVPDSLKSGNYLLRHEILALHSAGSTGGGQFYPMCANLKVTGSGSAEPSSSDTVSFPGAYKASDPGILVNIYNGLSSYTIPGPAVWSGSGSKSAKNTDNSAKASSSSSESKPTTTASPTTARPTASVADTTAAAQTTTSPAAAKSNSSPQPATVTVTVTVTEKAAASTATASSSDSNSGSSSGSDSSSDPVDYNTCMRNYNKCLDAAQPKSGGSAKLAGCSNNCSQYKK